MFERRSARLSKLPILMLGAALALGCCLSAGAEDTKPVEAAKPAEASKGPKVYRLEPGDEIAITVAPQKGFDSKGVILPDGSLRLAGIGKITAGGMSLDELEEFVRKTLSKELKDPDVTATLEKMHDPPKPVEKPIEKLGRVTVVGAVVKAGPLDLERGLRLVKAIDLAGGATKDADLTNVLIIHQNLKKEIVNLSSVDNFQDPDINLELRDGDSVTIPAHPDKTDLPPAAIRGAVEKAGEFQVKQGIGLEALVVMAGGLTQLADLERIQVLRAGQQQHETINWEERYRQGIPGKIIIHAGDEVFIPTVKDTVSVIGAIQRGGRYAIKPGETTILDLLKAGIESLAGATNGGIIDLNKVELIRNGEKPRRIALKSLLDNPGSKENVVLANGDIIYLPAKQEHRGGFLEKLGQLSPLTLLFGAF